MGSMLNDGWFRTLHWTCQLCPKDLMVLHPVVCHPAVSGQRIHHPVDHAQAFSATCRRTNVTLGLWSRPLAQFQPEVRSCSIAWLPEWSTLRPTCCGRVPTSMGRCANTQYGLVKPFTAFTDPLLSSGWYKLKIWECWEMCCALLRSI